jgi:hypothetical protein
MKTARFVQSVIVTLAIVGMCLPPAAFAVDSQPVPTVADVALSDGGTLQGQVLNLDGTAAARVSVAVRTPESIVATTTTADDGTFSIQGIRGGVYQVVAGQGQGVYRMWSAGTAPPVAQTSATVYTQSSVVDNNAVVYTGYYNPDSPMKAFLTNPLVIGAMVAAAIAVPVVLCQPSHHSH